jgi:hypothetical protein
MLQDPFQYYPRIDVEIVRMMCSEYVSSQHSHALRFLSLHYPYKIWQMNKTGILTRVSRFSAQITCSLAVQYLLRFPGLSILINFSTAIN